MKNFKTLTDFETYKVWQNVPDKSLFRREINRIESELQGEQSQYMQLHKGINTEYANTSGDLDKLESLESEFEKSKATIKKLKKERQTAINEREQAEVDRAEAWQAFLVEVAESGYLEALAAEYKEAMQRAHQLNNALYQFCANPTLSKDLRIFYPAKINFWGEDGKDDAVQNMVNRLDEIKTGNYKHRKLKMVS